MTGHPHFPKRTFSYLHLGQRDMSEKRGMILAYLAEEQHTKIQAKEAMEHAEDLFKRAASQYSLSQTIILDLLDDYNDVEELPNGYN